MHSLKTLEIHKEALELLRDKTVVKSDYAFGMPESKTNDEKLCEIQDCLSDVLERINIIERKRELQEELNA